MGDKNTYVYLYDDQFNKITEESKGGENSNFKIRRLFDKGETYYFCMRLVSRTETGSFAIKLEEANYSEASGYCGQNLTWNLADGLLTISGKGEMRNFWYSNEAPWRNYRDDVVKIIIEDGVTSIGSRAFLGMNYLRSADIPDSVTTIGDNAFGDCYSLRNVKIPYGVTSLGFCAFEGCDITKIEIPDSVTSIGGAAFRSCRLLTSVEIPDSVTSIADATFQSCRLLTSVEIPDSVTCIENYAFSGSGLTSIEIPDSVTSIGDYAFEGCPIKSIILPNSISRIGDGMLSYCNILTNVVIPDNVTSIGDFAFCGCRLLANIEFPNSIKDVGDFAFANCLSLKEVKFKGDAPSFNIKKYRQNFRNDTLTAYYPCQKSGWTKDVKQNYAGHVTWVPWNPETGEVFASEKEIVLRPGQSVCLPVLEKYGTLENISVDSGIISVNQNTLTALQSGTAEAVIEYSAYRFTYNVIVAAGDNVLTFPSELKSIEEEAFVGVSGIQFAELGDAVEVVKKDAFLNTEIRQLVVKSAGTVIDPEALDKTTLSGLTIICQKGSSAESFAIENGCTLAYLE